MVTVFWLSAAVEKIWDFFGWNDGITGNQLGHDTTDSFNTHGKRVDVKQNHISTTFFSREDSSLYSSSISNSFVRINASGRFLSIEILFDQLLNLWNTGRSSDKYNFINIFLLHQHLPSPFEQVSWLNGKDPC